jgi:hypothetical protein
MTGATKSVGQRTERGTCRPAAAPENNGQVREFRTSHSGNALRVGTFRASFSKIVDRSNPAQ